MGSIGKPGSSLTLEGKYCAGVSPHKADKTTEFLAVSAVAFNWADSYDAKVHCSIFRSKVNCSSEKKDWPRLRKIVAPTLLVRISSNYLFFSCQYVTLTVPTHI